jgi:predicted small secreted protein
MKKFILVVLIVLIAIGILAACAQVTTIENGISDITQQITDRAIPTWVIIIGAVIVFFIAFGIVWKLIPGFIKVIVLIVIAAAIAGAAYGLWTIPAYDAAENFIEENITETPSDE